MGPVSCGMSPHVEAARKFMNGLKPPQHYDKVYKDECAFTLDTPYSEGGLAVNLKTWVGVAADMVDVDLQRNGGEGGLYLLQKFSWKEKNLPKDAPQDIGLLLEDKYEIIKEYSLLVADSGEKNVVKYPDVELPTIISQVCDAIIAHQGARAATEATKFEEELRESKYSADLVQLSPTKKISPNPKDWKCEKSGDTQNLWLNLSDGHIGSGRRFFDGSGGSNGALDHFKEEQEKGKFFPLVVKLGTITPQGADVYSYAPDEDDMVKNSFLAKHLEHWGIDIMRMEKTDKSLAEMQVDFNLNYDWTRICESGEDLVKLRGPGLIGLKNLGNSCYLNSTVQLLLGLPEAKQRYGDEDMKIRKKAPADPAGDLITQLAKLTNALTGPRYANPSGTGALDDQDPRLEVAPQMFRALIGKSHPEFATNHQQDAAEFLQYFFEQVSRGEHTALGSRLEEGNPFASMFEFAIEERLQEVGGARRVKYKRNRHNMLGVPVKLDDADNLTEIEAYRRQHPEEKEAKKPKREGEPEEPKPIIHLDVCLNRFVAPEDGIAFRGSTVSKTTRMATMPHYLIVQVQRYYVDEKWMPNKLDCRVPMPAKLSLEHLRGKGIQPGEEAFPEDDASAEAAPAEGPKADDMIVMQLISMDISDNAAKKAAVATNNSGAEAAIAWYFEHSCDADINDPPGNANAGDGASDADPESVMMLCSMGFSEVHARGALKACGNNTERAADWLFSHTDDLDAAIASLSGGGGGGSGPATERVYDDGVGEYNLVGFISHIGRHTACGHYVCHAKRGNGGEWVIFNDEKVAKSETPPLELGYLYLYRRSDAM